MNLLRTQLGRVARDSVDEVRRPSWATVATRRVGPGPHDPTVVLVRDNRAAPVSGERSACRSHSEPVGGCLHVPRCYARHFPVVAKATYRSGTASTDSVGTGGCTGSLAVLSAPPSSGRRSTSQQPRRHSAAWAHLSTNGVRYHHRSHRGARSTRGAAPPGGSQSHAARWPSGTTHPPGDRTRWASRGSRTPRHGSSSFQLRPWLPYCVPMPTSILPRSDRRLVAAT